MTMYQTFPQLNQHNMLKKQLTQYLIRVFFASLFVTQNSWAVSCDAFPQNHANNCICKTSQVSVGYWYTSGSAPANYDTHSIHLCTDANDTSCGTALTGAYDNLLSVTNGEILYLANKTATPTEYFKCTFTQSVGFETTAHTHTVVTASVHSVGGIIFAISSLLLISVWGVRQKKQPRKSI
ncbi:hypothetical protein QUF74_05960 [Candidatus Halobeggiatoa sp. HSG11]|nr:hypothetical protein [Candidatus Halobeggiatoa sp. HSG11]